MIIFLFLFLVGESTRNMPNIQFKLPQNDFQNVVDTIDENSDTVAVNEVQKNPLGDIEGENEVFVADYIDEPNQQEYLDEHEVQRIDNLLHLPEFDKKKSGSRCVLCKKTTHVMCAQCKIHLCFLNNRNCYKLFHMDQMKFE